MGKTIVLEPRVQLDGTHIFVEGTRLSAVTKFITQFKAPFPRDEIAKRVANRDGKSVEEVLLEWSAKGERSRAAGSALHQYIEETLNEVHDDPLDLMLKTPEMIGFDNFMARSVEHLTLIAKEFPIGFLEWGLAGRPDAIFLSDKTGELHVFDWKRGEIGTKDWGRSLLKPFEGLVEHDLNYYSLQVWLYTMMLEKVYPEYKWGRPYLVSFADERYQAYPGVLEVLEAIEQNEFWNLNRAIEDKEQGSLGISGG